MLAASAVLICLVARLRVVVIPMLIGVIFVALLTPLVDLLDRVMPHLLASGSP